MGECPDNFERVDLSQELSTSAYGNGPQNPESLGASPQPFTGREAAQWDRKPTAMEGASICPNHVNAPGNLEGVAHGCTLTAGVDPVTRQHRGEFSACKIFKGERCEALERLNPHLRPDDGPKAA